MGASVSKNSIDVMTDAIAKVASTVSTESSSVNEQTSIIKVDKTKGSVIISGNVFVQEATIDQRNLLNNLNSATVQQDIVQQATQQAKSSISGLNLGQYADSQNLAKLFSKTTIDICNDLSYECLAKNNQTVSITATNTAGSVTIENNLSEQLGRMFNDCVAASANTSDSGQKLLQALAQKATSTAEGIDITALLIALVIGFAVFTFGTMYFGTSMMTMLFPIIGVVGIGLCTYYVVLVASTKSPTPVKEPLKFKRIGFKSKGIKELFPEKRPTKVTPGVLHSNIQTTVEASEPTVLAYTWEAANGNLSFYDDFTSSDVKTLTESPIDTRIPVTEARVVTGADREPDNDLDKADIYLRGDTGVFYQKHRPKGSAIDVPETWTRVKSDKQSKVLPLNTGSKMELLQIPNVSPGAIIRPLADAIANTKTRPLNNCLAVYCKGNPNEFLIYRFDAVDQKPNYVDSVKVGGLKVNDEANKEAFVSGYRILPEPKPANNFGQNAYLISGIILTIFGFGGYAVEKIYGDKGGQEEEGEKVQGMHRLFGKNKNQRQEAMEE